MLAPITEEETEKTSIKSASKSVSKSASIKSTPKSSNFQPKYRISTAFEGQLRESDRNSDGTQVSAQLQNSIIKSDSSNSKKSSAGFR